MRIGIDVRALEGSPHGGVPQYVRNIVPALIKAAPSHEFVLFSNSYRGGTQEIQRWEGDNATVASFHYPNKLFLGSTRFCSFPRIDRLIGGVDVFFSPHTLPLPLSKEAGHVAVFHDLSFERFPRFFDRRRRLWHRLMDVRGQAERADALIAVSVSTKRDLQNIYGVDEDRIRVVYPGAPHLPSTSPQAQSSLAAEGIRAPYILSVCTLEPRKNLVTLIRAFTLLKREGAFAQVRLVIAGPRGWLWEDIVEAAQKSAVREDIIIAGSIEKEHMSQLYAGASLFVYPSFYEGFGFPPLEAMKQGVPVISSMSSSLPEVVGNAALLIDPNRTHMLSSSMAEVLRDAELARELSAAGLMRASQFSWDKSAEEIRAVLEEVGERSSIHKVF